MKLSKNKVFMNVTLKGSVVHLAGALPALHHRPPEFTLVDKDLKDRHLSDWKGKKILLATVPSLDTTTCNIMTKHLNGLSQKHPHLVIITVSVDLPFAQKRFCQTENVHQVCTLSMMRDKKFGQDYGLLILDGPLAGLLARSIILLDEQGRVVYLELVSEISKEPNYTLLEAAIG